MTREEREARRQELLKRDPETLNLAELADLAFIDEDDVSPHNRINKEK